MKTQLLRDAWVAELKNKLYHIHFHEEYELLYEEATFSITEHYK